MTSSNKLERSPFVEDLIPLILETSEHYWRRDYVRLVRVSRAWAGPIRKRLYRHPTLYSFQACELLARTLSENPSLAHLVSGLHLYPCVDEGGRVKPSETAGLRRLLTIPNLEELSLGGNLSIRAERFLMSLTSPQTIKVLRIDGSTDRLATRWPHQQASLEWDSGIAARFRSLKRLELTDIELEIIPPAARCALPLESVRLDCVYLTGGFVERLAVGAWSRLRSLHVTARSASEYNEQVRFLLSACAETIESFEYTVLQEEGHGHGEGGDEHAAGSFIDPDPALKFPVLRRVELGSLAVTPEVLLEVDRRCPALTDLSVHGRTVLVTPAQWSEMICNSTWPKLKKLLVPGGTGPPFVAWSERIDNPIEEACIKREIEFCRGESGEFLVGYASFHVLGFVIPLLTFSVNIQSLDGSRRRGVIGTRSNDDSPAL